LDEPHLAHLDDFVGEVLPDVNHSQCTWLACVHRLR
jgi:hypothetical protein